MTSTNIVAVDATELRDAFDFVSGGVLADFRAYICRDTGRIYCVADGIDPEEDTPDDLGESDRYISVPNKHDLNLGRSLATAFAEQEMPRDAQNIWDIFRRCGAYRRFKDLLDRRDMLQRWYDFEERETDKALRAWCEDIGIQPVQASRGPD